MCEVCDLREKTEQLYGELEFRFKQFQVELLAGRQGAAIECEKRIDEIKTAMLANMRKAHSLKEMAELGQDLSETLSKALN